MSDVQNPVDTAVSATDTIGQTEAQSGLGDSYEFVFPDGEKFEAKSRSDLDKFIKGHYFRQKDYTQKTQSLSARAKEIEKKESDFQKQFEAFQKKASQYDEWDKTLRTRPGIYQQLQKLATSPASTSDAYERAKSYADEQLAAMKEELESLKKERQADASERELMEIMSTMKGKYRDFDEGRVRELLTEMADGNLEPLIRNLYFATRGMDPNIQKRVVQKLAEKAEAGMVPSGGGTMPSGNGKGYRSLEAAAQAAKRELGS